MFNLYGGYPAGTRSATSSTLPLGLLAEVLGRFARDQPTSNAIVFTRYRMSLKSSGEKTSK